MLIHDFSNRAEECLRLAQRSKSIHDRELFIEMARAWNGLTKEPVPVRPERQQPH